MNQVGYPADSAKRAYLMSNVAETGATFAVKNDAGTTLFSGSIGQALGAWSNAYPYVYALDFAAVTATGTYSIEVTGPVPATSPSFGIDTGQAVYQQALANALSFYQTERDGPNFIPGPLRTAAAHLNDQNAMTYLSAARQLQRALLGRPHATRNPDRRVGQLVGRGGLHQGRADARATRRTCCSSGFATSRR